MKTMNNLTISGVASPPPCGTTTRNPHNSLIRCDEGPTLRNKFCCLFTVDVDPSEIL